MDSSKFFESKYLEAKNFANPQTATINNVATEPVGVDQKLKLVVYFRGFLKGLILNKTNHQRICEAWGPETDNWLNKELEIYQALTTYKNQEIPCIRVKIPAVTPSQTTIQGHKGK